MVIEMKELLEEVDQRLNYLIYADDECRKTALVQHKLKLLEEYEI